MAMGNARCPSGAEWLLPPPIDAESVMVVPFSMSRARSIAWRFGVSPRPMEARMAHFDALTAEFGVRPTWAVTARVLQRNPAAIHRFLERGVELAVHLPHDDLSLRSPAGQRAGIAHAAQAFRDAEVPF